LSEGALDEGTTTVIQSTRTVDTDTSHRSTFLAWRAA
jgi:hypothetical protein